MYTHETYWPTLMNKAAEILRLHGINAYAQGDSLTIYARSTDRFTPVASWSPEAFRGQDWEPGTMALFVLERLTRLVRGPHTHEMEMAIA